MKKIICTILMALTCLCLFACTPSSVEKAKDKMKKEGYTVLAYSDKEAEGLIGGLNATKMDGLDVDNITALLFETTKDAKKFMAELADSSKAIRDGKWVYWGTEDAIDDFTD